MKGLFVAFVLVTITSAQWTPDPSCPYPSQQKVRFPYTGDCTKYWECYNGAKYILDCPKGLEYNNFTHRCDPPNIAHCDHSITTPTEKTTTALPDLTCKSFPIDQEFFLPFPGDCTKYIECYGGNRFNYICPGGLYWHQEIRQCDYPENSNCHQSTDTTNKPTQTTPLWTPDPFCPYPSEEIYRFPYQGNCSKYWECYEGTKYVLECPKGFEFNAFRHQCDPPEIAQCKFNTTTTTSNPTPNPTCKSFPPNREFFVPFPGDCAKYIECYGGTGYTHTCPQGLFWHQDISQCDFPERSNCHQTTTVTQTPTTTVTSASTETSTRRTTASPFECPKKGTSFFPYPKDCTKYYQCSEGTKVVMICPKGLYWNQPAGICDYPENVDCQG